MSTTTTTKIRYALVEYATNKQFLNVYDALAIQRIEWELVDYDLGTRSHRSKANAFIEVDKMRLLAHLVSIRFSAYNGWKMDMFTGSERDGKPESRVFTWSYDLGDKQQFANYPYRLSLSTGPGQRTPTGAYKPAGKPTTQLAIRLSEDDLISMCLTIRDHLLVHQRDLEAIRRAEQEQRFVKA